MSVQKVKYTINDMAQKDLVNNLAQTRAFDYIHDGLLEMDMANNFNFGYTGTFYLGSDKQPIRAIFDTGSANSWILSKDAVNES